MNNSFKPNVKIRDDNGQLTEEVVRGIITNPVYAGVGEYERIVSDQLWIEANKVALEKDDVDQYLTNLVYCLEQSFGCKIKNKEEWIKSAKTNIENVGKKKFLKIFLIHVRNIFRNSLIKRTITLPIADVIILFIKYFAKHLNRVVKVAVFVLNISYTICTFLNIPYHQHFFLYTLHFSFPFSNRMAGGGECV